MRDCFIACFKTLLIFSGAILRKANRAAGSWLGIRMLSIPIVVIRWIALATLARIRHRAEKISTEPNIWMDTHFVPTFARESPMSLQERDTSRCLPPSAVQDV